FKVILSDISADLLERGTGNISKSLDRFVKKETITEEQKAEILGRIETTTEIDGLKVARSSSRRPPRISALNARSFRSSTISARKTRSSRRTHLRSLSLRSPRRRSGPIR